MYVIPATIAAIIVAGVMMNSSSSSNSIISKNCYNEFDYVQKIKNIPFAIGDCKAFWPVLSTHPRRFEVPFRDTDGDTIGNMARSFGAIRGDGSRYHVGIDLYCNDQDICVACEDGVIVGIQGFLNITKAMLLQTNSGIVCLYGEIENYSWKDFGIDKGSVVKKGQKICRIGKNQAGTQMLHFETYAKGTTKNIQWYTGNNPSPNILNPTKYLLNIASRLTAKV